MLYPNNNIEWTVYCIELCGACIGAKEFLEEKGI